MEAKLKITFLLVLFVLILTMGCSVIRSATKGSGLEEYFSYRMDQMDQAEFEMDDWMFDLFE